MHRRQFLKYAGASAAVPWVARAQSGAWPQALIRLVVPFPPGGGTDTVSRMMAERLSTLKKWQVIVENSPGAAGNIGLAQVAKARPDGYMLAMAQTSNMAINPALYAHMPFDPLKDLQPIGRVCAQPVVLVVRQNSPLKSLAQFVQQARQSPGKYTVAQAGMGTVGHLAGEMLAHAAGIRLMQVPYKGAGPAVTDLMGGQVDAYVGSAASVMPHLHAGTIRGLAVTSAQRLQAVPGIPTVAEQGYEGFEATTWLGIVGPVGLPDGMVHDINAAIGQVLAAKDVQDRLNAEGDAPSADTPQDFAQFIRKEHAKWGGLIREAHITIS